MAPKNAIEQRLDIIEEQWFTFTGNAGARLGRWRLDGDGIKLVEVFLEAQTLEDSAVPDFFMRLTVPFTDPHQHGLRLRGAFIEEIEAAAGDMKAAGVDPAWPVPLRDAGLDDIGHLLMCMHAFRSFYADLFERLVVVLMVSEIADPNAWEWWLERLLQRGAPENLRFMVFDNAAAPVLDQLADRYPKQLMTLAPELDMPGAIDSLVRSVGGTAPADLYRRMFVGMSTAAQRGSITGALALGASALAVAERQGWTQQVAVVHMAAGAILMGAGRIPEAVAKFRASGAAAAASRDLGDPGSDRVVVQAKLSEGTALLQAGALEEAAGAYEGAIADVAKQRTPDPLLLLESRRMAAHCYERMRRPDMAWHHLGTALQSASAIEESQRLMTTLPFVMQSLLRLTEQPGYSRYRHVVEGKIAELLGPSWPKLIMEKLPA